MARQVKWLAGAFYTLAVLGALAFSARQAFAARKATDPCPCSVPFDFSECSNTDCCPSSGVGMCTTQFDCICE